MSSEKQCAEYFRSRPEYKRCFEALWKKWRSYGRAAGKITLNQASVEERRAIGGIVGKTYLNDRIQFSFSEFEQGLQKTRYAPVDMKLLLEAYFGRRLLTRQAQEQEVQRSRDRFLQNAYEDFCQKGTDGSNAAIWMQSVLEEKNYGYSVLCREYAKAPTQAQVLTRSVGGALERLQLLRQTGEELPLAVFAAEVSGNPHYFDRGSTAGMLLTAAICRIEQEEMPKNAYQWRELLQKVGIVPDNVSSMLHVYGLRLKTGHGWHPAYDAFCAGKEPYVITMENLQQINGAQPVGNRVYIVENEMVFSYLLHHVKNPAYTLLCTSGQLRAAAQKLIALLAACGTELCYSGDLDPDGMGIADRLWQKHGEKVHLWHMSWEDYTKSCSGERIGERELAKLDLLQHPQLREAAACVRKEQRAGYQENILDELLKDIETSQCG